MTKKLYYVFWAGLFILCAGLGFIPEPSGFLKYFMTALSVLFFLPPAVLVYFAGNRGDSLTLKLIRNLSAASLVLSLLLIIGNFMSLMASEAVGNVLYAVLVIVSSPMVCSGFWVLSLFLWTCLLMASMMLLKRK